MYAFVYMYVRMIVCVYVQFITLSICNNGYDLGEIKHFSKQCDKENI
jgi:hypothetical protein